MQNSGINNFKRFPTRRVFWCSKRTLLRASNCRSLHERRFQTFKTREFPLLPSKSNSSATTTKNDKVDEDNIQDEAVVAASGNATTKALTPPKHRMFLDELRFVFAVITIDAVNIYDTQQAHPISMIKDLHYADLTDASWTADGQTLSISSAGGYISFIHFEEGFFGTSVRYEDQIALNEAKMRRMFTTPKKARKKAKSQAQSQVALKEQTPTKNAIGKQNLQPADSIKDTGHASEGSTAANSINVLVVRKKRKLSSTSVQPAVTSLPPFIGLCASTSPLASTTPASRASAPRSSSAEGPITSHSTAGYQTGSQVSRTPSGTFEEPLDI